MHMSIAGPSRSFQGPGDSLGVPLRSFEAPPQDPLVCGAWSRLLQLPPHWVALINSHWASGVAYDNLTAGAATFMFLTSLCYIQPTKLSDSLQLAIALLWHNPLIPDCENWWTIVTKPNFAVLSQTMLHKSQKPPPVLEPPVNKAFSRPQVDLGVPGGPLHPPGPEFGLGGPGQQRPFRPQRDDDFGPSRGMMADPMGPPGSRGPAGPAPFRSGPPSGSLGNHPSMGFNDSKSLLSHSCF